MQFVHEDGSVAAKDHETRKRIRAQAMRDYRRRQRDHGQPDSLAKWTTAPGLSSSAYAIELDAVFQYQSIRELNPRIIERAQMLEILINTAPPSWPPPKGERQLLRILADLDLSTIPLLDNAVSMITYSHMGNITARQSVIQQSMICYGNILAGLRRELQVNRYDLPAVIATIIFITSHKSQNYFTDSLAHFDGALLLIKSRGPLSGSHPLTPSLHFPLITGAVFSSLAQRKALSTSVGEWIAMEDSVPTWASRSQSVKRLYHLSFWLSEVVSKVERVCRCTASTHEVLQIYNELNTWRFEAENFLSHQSGLLNPLVLLNSDMVHVTDLDDFDVSIEEQAFMITNSTISAFFRMASDKLPPVLSPLVLLPFWMFSLMADCTLLRLLHFYPLIRPSHQPYPQFLDEIKRCAWTTARHICQGLYHASSVEEMGFISFYSILVALVREFFAELGASKEVTWCEGVSCATKARYARLEAKGRRQMSRVGELEGSIASHGQFRMPPMAQ